MTKANQKPALQDLSLCPTVEAILKKVDRRDVNKRWDDLMLVVCRHQNKN
jgi:hypothetical protein